MTETPEAGQTARFDPIGFSAAKPLATPEELAVAFGQLIDSIGDMTGERADRVITPGLSAITVSWSTKSVTSTEWLREVEEQLVAFGACAGVQVRFRRH
jgi:hypothetical protein